MFVRQASRGLQGQESGKSTLRQVHFDLRFQQVSLFQSPAMKNKKSVDCKIKKTIGRAENKKKWCYVEMRIWACKSMTLS
jgi:hypothetical protein